jgi:hypothetical protein
MSDIQPRRTPFGALPLPTRGLEREEVLVRSSLAALLLLFVATSALDGQVCKKVPPPFLPGLMPESVMGMTLQIGTDPTGGCTGMYRPQSAAARQSQPWAMLSLKPNPDPTLGEDADAIRARYETQKVFTMGGWPVVMRKAPLGDEFVAIKGGVCVTVLVKNGDHGEASRALAEALMEQVLPELPCG